MRHAQDPEPGEPILSDSGVRRGGSTPPDGRPGPGRARRRLARVARLLAPLAACAAASCGAKDDPAVIDRAVFIDTYVDLRKAALAAPSHTHTAADRERVLEEHGVTDQDLLHFVDVRGADPQYMVRLWTDIGNRLPLAPLPPSAGGPSEPAKP